MASVRDILEHVAAYGTTGSIELRVPSTLAGSARVGGKEVGDTIVCDFDSVNRKQGKNGRQARVRIFTPYYGKRVEVRPQSLECVKPARFKKKKRPATKVAAKKSKPKRA